MPWEKNDAVHGPTDGVSANWTTGMRLRLTRVPTGGAPEEVLAPDAWSGFLQPNAFESTTLAIANVTRTAEWLAPADQAGLTPGRYRLDVTWDGRGLAPEGSLPAGGVVTLAAMTFEVASAVTPAQQALHQRHLAWERFVRDDPSGTLACVREADRLDPSGTDPAALQSRFIAVASAARLRDAFGTVQLLETLRSSDGSDDNHFASFATAAFRGLAPRLRLTGAPAAARIEVTAAPGGTYVLERSRDLAAWTAISTNTPATSPFEVPEPADGTGTHRYFRVRWLR